MLSPATAALLAFVAPVAARAAEDAPSCDRPAITLLRYDEDHSFLRDPRCRTERWDRLKYLELNGDLPLALTLGLDVRERFERFGRFDWGEVPNAPTYDLLSRIMPHAALRAGAHFELFFQLTSNLVWGRDPRPLDRDDLDVLQAFAALSLGSFALRAGRQ
jgi:hypothetical protein